MIRGAGLFLILFFDEFIGDAVTKRWRGSRSSAKEPSDHGHREGAQDVAGV